MLVCSTSNNANGNKLMIFSGITLYYGDTYIANRQVFVYAIFKWITIHRFAGVLSSVDMILTLVPHKINLLLGDTYQNVSNKMHNSCALPRANTGINTCGEIITMTQDGRKICGSNDTNMGATSSSVSPHSQTFASLIPKLVSSF